MDASWIVTALSGSRNTAPYKKSTSSKMARNSEYRIQHGGDRERQEGMRTSGALDTGSSS
jgi:hypothetical protein